MTMHDAIEAKLNSDLHPTLLQIENESHMHSGPATESHFKVTAVAELFTGMSLVKRHQRVYGLLATELRNDIHALALHLFSPAEWEARQHAVTVSPACRGGSKS